MMAWLTSAGISKALASPLVRALGVLLAVFAVLMTVYNAGARSAARKCEVAGLKAEIAILKRDNAISKEAEMRATTIAAALEQSNAEQAKRIEEYEAAIAKKPASARCVLDRDDVRRLQSIR